MHERLIQLRQTHRHAKRREVDRLIHYISDRRQMIRYPRFLANGWRIGSGPMESECRGCCPNDSKAQVNAGTATMPRPSWPWRRCTRANKVQPIGN